MSRIPPRVSVVMPAFNAESSLLPSIRSLQAQEETSWELLLVVDCNSQDRTLDLAMGAASNDPRIRIISNLPKGGCAYNRNHALREAQGDFVAFLDSDDLWEPQKLTLQLRLMEQEAVDFSCTGYRWIDAQGSLLPIIVRPPSSITYHDLLSNNKIGCLTVMYRRVRFPNLQFADFLHEDYILWLSILRETSARGIPDILASYRVADQSRSRNKAKAAMARWRILRKFEKLSLVASLRYFTEYAIGSLVRRSDLNGQ